MSTGYLIKVVPCKLTDGSRVFDVHVSDSGADVQIFACIDEPRAHEFAETLAAAIQKLTVENARVVTADYYMVRP